jgi:hypothetical protein
MPPNLGSTVSGGIHIRQRVPRRAGWSAHEFQSASPSAAPFVDLPQQFGDLPATVVAGDQQQPMQPKIVLRLIGMSDFLLDGQAHGVGIHDKTSCCRCSLQGLGMTHRQGKARSRGQK